MKYSLPYILLCLLPTTASAQSVAIQADYDRVLYQCVENPVTVARQGIDPKNIFITTNNGTIATSDSESTKGHYRITPLKTGKATIYIHQRLRTASDKIIDSIVFPVLKVPVPTAHFMSRKRGYITPEVVRAGIALSTYYDGSDFSGGPTLSRFSVVVIRQGHKVFERSHTGYVRFDSVTHAFFQQIQHGDKLIFRDLEIDLCNGAKSALEPLEFTIGKAPEARKDKKNIDNLQEDLFIEDPITGQSQIIHRKR